MKHWSKLIWNSSKVKTSKTTWLSPIRNFNSPVICGFAFLIRGFSFNKKGILLLSTENAIYGWREASKCTTSVNQFENSNEKISNPNDNDETNSNNEITAQFTSSNLLELNCENNLIFIASSHFGQRSVNRVDKKSKTNLFHLNSNSKNSTVDNSE